MCSVNIRECCGIVTKDRASSSLGSHAVGSEAFRFFHPVVATFYAFGDSEDTHDTSGPRNQDDKFKFRSPS